MNSNDIFSYDFSTLTEKCGSAVSATLVSMFLRYSIETEDLNKIKSGKMEEFKNDEYVTDKEDLMNIYDWE